MIYDTLRHLERYAGMHPGVLKGLQFLAETNFSSLPDQRFEIDGEKVFAFLQTYDTKPANERPEAHRRYIDIQYLVQGEELVGVGPLEDMRREVDAVPDNDAWFYEGPLCGVTIGNGRFLVLFPQDAHAPGIAVGAPCTVRKCVVKVLADWPQG